MYTYLETNDRVEHLHLVDERFIGGLPIRVYQDKKNKEVFAVQYDERIWKNKSNLEASKQLGCCTMHALLCNGNIK